MIYFDNAATTSVDEQVTNKVAPYITGLIGNPSSIHNPGQSAKEALKEARENVARFLHTDPRHIAFTSGGTESNNMVIKGLKDFMFRSGKTTIITTSVEHDSIINPLLKISAEPWNNIIVLNPDESGVISPEQIENCIKANPVGFVSVMYVNNETGRINDVKKIGEICKKNNVLFHTDCVQAASCLPLNVDEIGCDFMSLSAHKIHGIKGCGVLYIRNKESLTRGKDWEDFDSLIEGGHAQEGGYRAGTENIPGIVGMGEACKLLIKREFDPQFFVKIKTFMMSRLEELLKDRCEISSNSLLTDQSGILNIRFHGVDAETLVIMMNTKGLCASSGSACRSLESVPSRVLVAIGLSEDEARESVRFSFSRDSTFEEVEKATLIIKECVDLIRKI